MKKVPFIVNLMPDSGAIRVLSPLRHDSLEIIRWLDVNVGARHTDISGHGWVYRGINVEEASWEFDLFDEGDVVSFILRWA